VGISAGGAPRRRCRFAKQKISRRTYRNDGRQNSIPSLRGKETPMKLKTRIKAGRPGPNHNTIVR
jgi:hypothetical protein